MVLAVISFPESILPAPKAASASVPIIIPSNTILCPSPPEKRLSPASDGPEAITSSSGLSRPSATAGRESVIRFTQSRCIGKSGEPQPKSMAANTVIISPILLESRK